MEGQKTILHVSPGPQLGNVAARSIKAGGGFGLGALSYEEMVSLITLEEKYPEIAAIKDRDAKQAYIVELRKKAEREFLESDKELREKKEKLARLNLGHDGLALIETWASGDLRIEKPNGTSFKRMRKDVADGRAFYLAHDVYAELPSLEFEKEVFRHAEVLLIEHDWAGALQSADLANATVKLPYDVCAFEFQYSGRAVVVLATQFNEEIAFSPIVDCGDAWMVPGFVMRIGEGVENDGDPGLIKILNLLAGQIRAACIALDAKVARTDQVREAIEPGARTNYQALPKAYHVVSLARQRAAPLTSTGTETGRRVRLHFRRGHWRHFDTHKTWINWMLVGDPDLGFVEKHYRL